jgi:hypothetical protein
MTLELNALNVKIDQILQNQILIMQALVEIDSTLKDIQSKIADLPAETVSLQQAVDAQSLASTLANCIQTLVRHPNDARSHTDYGDYREQLNQVAAKLYAVVTQALVTPEVAVGAKYALHALMLYNKFDRRLGFTAASDRAKLSAISLNIIETLEGVTSESGIQRYVDLTRQKIPGARDSILKSPFSALLPKNFSEAVQPDANGNAVGSSTNAPFCMMSPFSGESIGFVPGQMGNVRTGTSGYPAENTMRYTRTIEHINYAVTKYVAYGGRPLYNVDVPQKTAWQPDTYRKVQVERFDYAPVPKSSDPDSKLAGCVEMANVANGSPESFATFTDLLGGYSVLAAMEGRYLALQQSALQDLDSAKKLDATLKHA